jgi:hypothetical protein
MKLFTGVFFTLFIMMNFSFGVYTKYINDFKFDNIENFEFSNVTFIEGGGLELARDYETIFTSPSMVWSLEKSGKGFLAGTGEKANLYLIEGNKNTQVFSSSNHVLFSDIQTMGDRVYLSALPRSTLFILDSAFHLAKTQNFSNQYIWNIIPAEKGYFILTGSPAEIYYFNEKDSLEWHIPIKGEENLLKGILIDQELYFIGDGNVLYKLNKEGKKQVSVKAVLSLDNNIADFIYYKNKIYLITSMKETKKAAQAQSENKTTDDDITSGMKNSSSEKRSRNGGKSSLYSYDLNGNVETLFEKNNFHFISLSGSGESIIVGCDKNAQYFEISLSGEKKSLSSLGVGRFVKFITLRNKNYALLLDPSRIIQLKDTFAKEGYFESSPFDTGNISIWGRPSVESVILPSTGISLFTRSGASDSTSLWDEWQTAKDTIYSDPNSFLQYRAVFFSDGKNTPLFKSVVIPYIQKNHAPRIEKINFNVNNANFIRVSWDAYEEDKDLLFYNIYLSMREKEWVKLNEKPLEENTFDIVKDNFPEGKYRIKIMADDSRSNPDHEAKTSFKTSDLFTIDNNPPAIGALSIKKTGENTIVAGFDVTDSLSPLIEASYSLNGGKWIKFLPLNGMFDSKTEKFEVIINHSPCYYLQFKVMDAFGNYETKGLWVE